MSAERIGHAAKSEQIAYCLVEAVIAHEGITDATIIATAIDAHRHATLALVEQQRIANLIAVASLNFREADFTKPWTSTEDTEAWRSVRDEVAEALGLA